MFRPQSWGPQCQTEERRVEYHCYSQLGHFIQDPTTSPHPAPVSSITNNTSREGEGESDGCPQSSLAQCTCDLELELSGNHFSPRELQSQPAFFLQIWISSRISSVISSRISPCRLINYQLLYQYQHYLYINMFSSINQGQHLYGFAHTALIIIKPG